MYRTVTSAFAALLISSTNAEAVTFGFSFLFDGDNTPGGGLATTLSDLVEIGRGTVTVEDDAVVPGGLATFSGGGVTGFSATIVDNLGNVLDWDLADDANTFFEDDFGVRFDASGEFERFDSPLFSTCTGCFAIYDDEYPAPFRTTQGAELMIQDAELRFGYLVEDTTRFGTEFAAGTIVTLSNFEGEAVVPFSNVFTAENSEIFRFTSGFMLSTGAVPDVTPVPLPATMSLFLMTLGGLGLVARRRR